MEYIFYHFSLPKLSIRPIIKIRRHKNNMFDSQEIYENVVSENGFSCNYICRQFSKTFNNYSAIRDRDKYNKLKTMEIHGYKCSNNYYFVLYMYIDFVFPRNASISK